MAYEIVYKRRFLNKMQNVLAYLEQQWGTKVANNFNYIVDIRIDILREHPYIGAPIEKENIRALYVTKHNRLFYRIENDKVIILNLYDTRKE